MRASPLLTSFVFALTGLASQAAFAQSSQTALTAAQARALIAPFYDALNQPAKKDVAALIGKATADAWVSCGDNAKCGPRAAVAAGISGLGTMVPDLRWEIKDVLVSGNQVTVRGEATGTPTGPFLGIAPTGRAFRVMSIDIHEVQGGKIVRTFHVEDWSTAMGQLQGK